jgi:hypothetical protein
MFTHGDLRPASIVVAILDCEQVGWYLDYWEYCKVMFATDYEGECIECIRKFLDPHNISLEAFDFYICTLGKFYNSSFNTTLSVWDPYTELSTPHALHIVD